MLTTSFSLWEWDVVHKRNINKTLLIHPHETEEENITNLKTNFNNKITQHNSNGTAVDKI
jgi:hypothetical protein